VLFLVSIFLQIGSWGDFLISATNAGAKRPLPLGKETPLTSGTQNQRQKTAPGGPQPTEAVELVRLPHLEGPADGVGGAGAVQDQQGEANRV